MISIAFPTHGSWQLGKFVNTEEDVNGYVTLKNQGTYIEMTNNTGQDLTGSVFFVDFMGSDFDALKWNLTPLSVLGLKRPINAFANAVLTDGTVVSLPYEYSFGALTDILYVTVSSDESSSVLYTTDGTTYNTYADVFASPNTIQFVNQDGVVGKHIYFTDQFGNVLKFWRIAFDYPHKYVAFIVQLETVDGVPVLFTNGSTIKVYIMTIGTSDLAQNIGVPPFMVIHPQIPGYVAGYPKSLTVDTTNAVVMNDYFTGVDSTLRLFVSYGYEEVRQLEGLALAHAFGHSLRYYFNANGSLVTLNDTYYTYWFMDVEFEDATADDSLFMTLFKASFSASTTKAIETFDAKILYPSKLRIGTINYNALGSYEYYQAEAFVGIRSLYLVHVDASFTMETDQNTRYYGGSIYLNGDRSYVSAYEYGSEGHADNLDISASKGYELYLSDKVKVYKIMKLGIPTDVLSLFSNAYPHIYYEPSVDAIMRYYNIPRPLTTGASGYWLSPIIDIGIQPPDFSVSWIADETYGRIDVDNIDPKEIECRYSIYPPTGGAHGTITDSGGTQHAYWDPDTEWPTASSWQKITSGDQLPPYRYVQFRISLQTD